MVAMWESRTPPDHLRGAWPVAHGPGSCRFRDRRPRTGSAGGPLSGLQPQTVAQRAEIASDREDGIAPPCHGEAALREFRLFAGLEAGLNGVVAAEQCAPGARIGLGDGARGGG